MSIDSALSAIKEQITALARQLDALRSARDLLEGVTGGEPKALPPKPSRRDLIVAGAKKGETPKPSQPKVKGKRRQFTADERRTLLEEFRAAQASGERGAAARFLEKHGLRRSTVHNWTTRGT